MEGNRLQDHSCDTTLSADEAKEILARQQEKRFYKTTALQLKSFPLIKSNIMKAKSSALQRLHIVLFESSVTGLNLRGNLLSFNGFPFKKESEEWEEKRSILSVLPKSTLKEFLDILTLKYNEDADIPFLISKFMNFLAAPITNLSGDGENMVIEPPNFSKPIFLPKIVPKIAAAKRKIVPIKPLVPIVRKREGLMNDAQVRCLEMGLAQEQKMLNLERQLHAQEVNRLGLSCDKTSFPNSLSVFQPTVNTKQPLAENHTNFNLLNALFYTVLKRREIKKAGKEVSIPKKHTRLGELSNVKFLIATANYMELDVLHHLIYMSEATNSRLRKNILDFSGFLFTENSPAYQTRMEFLTSLGYNISRRIAFLIGLSPYKTNIAQRDLNELIMYFLMSPCKPKQIPISHSSNTFFGKKTVHVTNILNKPTTPIPGQRARKSFRCAFRPQGSTYDPSFKKTEPIIITPKPVTKPASIVPQLTSGLVTPDNSYNPGEFLLQQQTPEGQVNIKIMKLTPSDPPNPVIRNKTSNGPRQIAPAPTPAPPPPPIIPNPGLKAQQAEIGQLKPIKLIPLTPNLPLFPTKKRKRQTRKKQKPLPVIGAPQLGPGIIVFKRKPSNPALAKVMQTVPLGIGEPMSKVAEFGNNPDGIGTLPVVSQLPGALPVATSKLVGGIQESSVLELPVPIAQCAVRNTPVPILPAPMCVGKVMNTTIPFPGLPVPAPVCVGRVMNTTIPFPELPVIVPESVSEGMDSTTFDELNFSGEDIEVLCPLEEPIPPTDEELFRSIRYIIRSCSSLENITLRNVINQVCTEFSAFDLTSRKRFMKECIEKVILET